MLLILKPGISKNNDAIKSEIKDILKEQNVKEYTIQESKIDDSKNYKLENVKDTIKDPYDQIKGFVEAQDTAYFNQLKAFELTKDSATQVKDKAVVYAILQDTALTLGQKKIMSLGVFEKLARMPGTEFRFTRKNSKVCTEDPKYEEKYQRYVGYRAYLDLLDIEKKIAYLDEQ